MQGGFKCSTEQIWRGMIAATLYHLHLLCFQTGQTPLSIAQKLGYISVVEILKNITEVEAISGAHDEKYKVVSPETMQEAAMTDSEDEGGMSSQ